MSSRCVVALSVHPQEMSHRCFAQINQEVALGAPCHPSSLVELRSLWPSSAHTNWQSPALGELFWICLVKLKGNRPGTFVASWRFAQREKVPRTRRLLRPAYMQSLSMCSPVGVLHGGFFNTFFQQMRFSHPPRWGRLNVLSRVLDRGSLEPGYTPALQQVRSGTSCRRMHG